VVFALAASGTSKRTLLAKAGKTLEQLIGFTIDLSKS